MTLARVGDTLYIGGFFSAVGPSTGGGVPLDLASGVPQRPFARVAGRVTAVVPDGSGGWFIGGHFTAVEGVPRLNLAHILADGSVAAWDPGVSGIGGYFDTPYLEFRAPGVGALVLEGNTLYAGGLFTTVGGRSRNNLAAIDATTGALRSWDPDANGEVRCLVVQGKTVHAGGEFTRIGGQPRNHIAAIDVRSGKPTTWDPSADRRVRALVVKGRTIHAGGDFDVIGGQRRNSIAALDVETGKATSWDVDLGPPRRGLPHGDWIWPYVAAIAVHGHTVYAGGSFESAGGQPRSPIAAFDAATGAVTDFDPDALAGVVNTIAVKGSTVYAGGALYDAGGEIGPNIVALDGTTGRVTSWNPRADNIVEALAVDGATVYAGGRFSSMYDWKLRNGLAALDLTTGAVTDWNPSSDGYGIRSLAAIGNTIYMLGPFNHIDGQTRSNIAAVDATTGRVTSWNPGPVAIGGYPLQPFLTASRNTVYLAGHSSDRVPPFLAALDPITAAPIWGDIGADEVVSALLLRDDTLYLGGRFRQIGGQPRRWLAALDATTAQLLPWNPLAAEPYGGTLIAAMAASGNTVYFGGTFAGAGSFPRKDLAAVNASTGDLLPWNPNPRGDYFAANEIHIRSLAVRGNVVWVGGKFSSMGGLPRPNLAVVDATIGVPTSWQPDPDDEVHVIATGGDTVYVGGTFRRLGGYPRGGIAAISVPNPAIRATPGARPTTTTTAFQAPSVGPCRPNPLRSSGVVGFALAQAERVSLSIYDLHGRRVTTLLDHKAHTAGAHEVRVDAAGWAAGVYFCRLETAGAVTTRKILVVN
ncbi:MAG: PQQ-binding-like beta-propeller repeat protein [Candidatus Eisenbacteria bacterium]